MERVVLILITLLIPNLLLFIDRVELLHCYANRGLYTDPIILLGSSQ